MLLSSTPQLCSSVNGISRHFALYVSAIVFRAVLSTCVNNNLESLVEDLYVSWMSNLTDVF